MLIKNFCEDFKERLKHLPSQQEEGAYLAEVISLCAWFQHQFVWIHPFKDYNGRVARLLTNLIFLEFGFPIVTIKAETGKDRERYIESMNAADEHDFTNLENLIAKALQESLEAT